MPYVSTGLKIADDNRIPFIRVFWGMVAAIVLALVAGFVAKTWLDYSFGGMSQDHWASISVPKIPFDNAARKIGEMSGMGMLERSAGASGLAKLGLLMPDKVEMGYFATGLLLVLGLALLRFRFTKVPLHPVIFLIWGTYSSGRVWFSFLVGWAIKSLVVKFGGGRVYQNLKPLFIGVIMAEISVSAITTLIGLAFYLLKGVPPDIVFSSAPG